MDVLRGWAAEEVLKKRENAIKQKQKKKNEKQKNHDSSVQRSLHSRQEKLLIIAME